LILLDEPESGVDTSGIIRLKADLTACAARGAIVILTGHVLDFLEKVCTRCIFLKDGRIVKDVSLKEKSVGLEALYEEIYGGN
ncbi:MAG: ABC transporter ATP-binding protein, partial [Lachnospiraceae bacterium]|nr:ABC transporter ATP-binding protein [Lachnospiraceae bacterium]